MQCTVSDPQMVWAIEPITVRKWVNWIVDKGHDPHEFATMYTKRTEELGYAPLLSDTAHEFHRSKSIKV